MESWYQREFSTEAMLPAFKAPEGESKFKIMGLPKTIQVPSFKDKSVLVEKLIFPIEYDGVKQAWFVSTSKHKDSLFAQICKLAQQNNGLEGALLKLLRVGSGMRTAYAISLA